MSRLTAPGLPLLSVIIPHYNSGGLLRRLLNSIPIRNDIQVIVIDDMSTDNSFSELTKDEKLHHVSFLSLDEKLGAGGARNLGLETAKGQFIVFADSDDYFENGAFETMIEASRKNLDLTLYRVSSFVENDGQPGNRHDYLKAIYREPGLFKYLAVDQPCGKLIKKELIDDYGIRFSEVPAGNDILFSAQVTLYAKRRGFVNEIVYQISQNSSSITANKDLAKDSARLQEQINKVLLIKSLTPRWFWFIFTCRRNALTLSERHPNSQEFRSLANFYRLLIPRTAKVIYQTYKRLSA